MANKTRSSFEKRQKEVSRQQRQKGKQAKRLEARQKTAEGGPDAEAPEAEEEDPDLAGIVLGPQPPAGVDDGTDDDDFPGGDEKP